MDRQAWIAIALCIAGLIGWQVYMVKHPTVPPAKVVAAPTSAVGRDSVEPGGGSASPGPGVAPGSTESRPTGAGAPFDAATPVPTATPAAFVEKTMTLRNADLELLLTNRGGGIAEAILPKHKGENGAPVKLSRLQRLPIGALVEKPAAPVLEEFSVLPGQGSVQFERALSSNVQLRKKFSVPAPPNAKDNYVAQLDLDFQNNGTTAYTNPGYFVALGSAAPIHHNDLPNYTRVTWCIDGKTKSTDVSWFAEQNYPVIGVQKRGAQEFFQEKINNAEWLGVSNQFFATLITPLGTKATEVWAQRFESYKKPDGALEYGIEGAMGMPGFTVKPGQTATVQFQLYIGPKLYNRLAQLTHDEGEIMDFGLWKLVSQTLLNLMNLIHRFVGNYAVAILILTAIIKLILWPLQTKANKSMRRMAALSPKMQELREKFKDDPTKMNAEVMRLYKDYGINPVSGCLPMLIQIPIFFGLFTMLRQAVELRNANFLWVHDLSQPDTLFTIPGLGWIPILGNPATGLPVNILPLIMAGTSFWMMRVTPKSGDATQQKVMMFMPLIFVVFCYNFAAALALYYTTQNLFTILQLYQNRNQPLPTLEKVNKPAKRKGKAR
ncbi:MAG: membrane protein insertase YidC [Chthoniobacterales bacterium]